MGAVRNHLRNKFLAGILAAIPVVVTVFIVWYVDSRSREILNVDKPFVGIAIAVVGVYVLGVFVTSFVGRYLITLTDHLLARLPGLKELYASWKQIALAAEGPEGLYARAALIPDDSGTMYLLGFCTGKPIEGDAESYCVFVPNAPNPIAGRVYFVPVVRTILLDMPTKEALKLVVSSGNYVPAAVGAALATHRARTSVPHLASRGP